MCFHCFYSSARMCSGSLRWCAFRAACCSPCMMRGSRSVPMPSARSTRRTLRGSGRTLRSPRVRRRVPCSQRGLSAMRRRKSSVRSMRWRAAPGVSPISSGVLPPLDRLSEAGRREGGCGRCHCLCHPDGRGLPQGPELHVLKALGAAGCSVGAGAGEKQLGRPVLSL